MTSSATLSSKIQILQSTVFDNRTANIRYRQNSLQDLHTSLLQHAGAIRDACSKDSPYLSSVVIEREFSLAMDAIHQCYSSLDFEHSLKEEYLVASGKSNEGRRIGFGLVVIRPGLNSRFYSIVSPLVAAIAAGNCVLVELESTKSLAVDRLFDSILSSSLDPTAFATSFVKVTAEDIPANALLVDQKSTNFLPNSKQLLSHPGSRALAVVDRSADIGSAAAFLVTARLDNASSAYAPDLVIVHEAVGEALGIACLKAAQGRSMEQSLTKDDLGSQSYDEAMRQDQILEAEKNAGKVKVHRYPGNPITVVEVLDNSSTLTTLKFTSPILIILPSTSLTNIVALQRFYSNSSLPWLATYVFAAPKTAKFLSEQIDSNASFINHIPVTLLIGPAAPASTTHPISIHPRYTPSMFSRSHPQFVALPSGAASTLEVSNALRIAATQKLKPTGQAKGFAIGFFEQGIFIGLGVIVLIVLPLLSFGLFQGIITGLQWWR